MLIFSGSRNAPFFVEESYFPLRVTATRITGSVSSVRKVGGEKKLYRASQRNKKCPKTLQRKAPPVKVVINDWVWTKLAKPNFQN